MSSSDSTVNRSTQAIPFGLLLTTLATTLALLRWGVRPDNTYRWLEIYNWAHIWLFAAVMLISTWALRLILTRRNFATILFVAVTGCIALAAGSEIMQLDAPGRNADIRDFGRDVTGIAIALAAILIWQQYREPTVQRLRNASIVSVVSLTMLGLASWPVFSMLQAYAEREPALPLLFSPDFAWSRPFVRNVRSKLTYSSPPQGFADFQGQNCLHVTTSTRLYSGVEFPDLHPDWSDYELLSLEIFASGKVNIPVLIRLDAARDPYQNDDWANFMVKIKPGSNRINVDLDALFNAFSNTAFNQSDVYNILVLTTDKRRHDLCFGDLLLQ